MNIQQAKEEIKHTLAAYLRKDKNGMYLYPQRQQRPLLLMGPPGIGKTAVMEQIARECGVGLVSYIMTHHTRQSAIGLPRIEKRKYQNRETVITEYTLSEIIASVYEYMENTGRQEGILFIDEINCVSETLSPVILQLLQNKRFGPHVVPEGWVIAAAGNPPGYNRSAREFDIVTLDRVRRIDIVPDLDIWLPYAAEEGVHSAIISYLKIRPERFYAARSTPEGKTFVTARGWEDLSRLLLSYEELDILPGIEQVREFISDTRTAEEFAAYYGIFRKYGTDYGIDRILAGTMNEEELQERANMAKNAGLEERFTVAGLLEGGILAAVRIFCRKQEEAKAFQNLLPRIGSAFNHRKTLEEFTDELENALLVKKNNDLLSYTQECLERTMISLLRETDTSLRLMHISGEEETRQYLTRQMEDLEGQAEKAGDQAALRMERAFAFGQEAFKGSEEMLLLVSGLARCAQTRQFLEKYPVQAFLKWSGEFIQAF